jgi:hypothetical protein
VKNPASLYAKSLSAGEDFKRVILPSEEQQDALEAAVNVHHENPAHDRNLPQFYREVGYRRRFGPPY